jgi:glycosyltransferase involved in cell wall biosynthesis
MKKRKLKILWSSNSPWSHSGYANQTKDLLYRFLNEGWNVACSCFYGLEGGMINVNGLLCYPKMLDTWGSDAAMFHANDFKADIVIPWQDMWPMQKEMLIKIPRLCPWVPIDHEPAPFPITDNLKSSYRIITCSEFGRKTLEKEGIISTMIHCGVDTNHFKPRDKKEMRDIFRLPKDYFMFGMVAANKDNPPRKSFQQVIDAFAKFQKKHPKSGIFFYTAPDQRGGFPIKNYCAYKGINPATTFYPGDYDFYIKADRDTVSKLICSFDVLLAPSVNEGFGLPIIEAQSSGVPVIVNDNTSMPELIIEGKTGYKTRSYHKQWSPIQGYISFPDTAHLLELMEKIYNDDLVKMGKEARMHILKNFDIDMLVKTKWNPFFEKIEQEIYG